MLLNAVIAATLMVTTTLIHIEATVWVVHILEKHHTVGIARLNRSHYYWISVIVLMMFFVSLLEVVCWTIAYLSLGALEGFEPALYFSMVTYTTLGYGDIVLDPRWRLISSFEAVNGIIMFGWTTAIVIYAVQNIHTKK